MSSNKNFIHLGRRGRSSGVGCVAAVGGRLLVLVVLLMLLQLPARSVPTLGKATSVGHQYRYGPMRANIVHATSPDVATNPMV